MKLSGNKKEIVWMWKQSKQIFIYLLLFVFLSVITSLCGVVFALASRSVIDTATGGIKGDLFLGCLWMLFIILAQLALQALYSILEIKATVKFEMSLKTGLFQKILNKEWLMMSQYHSGDLMTRITSDISIVSGGIIGIVPSIVALLTQLVAAFVVLLALDATFAVIALIIGPTVVLFGRYYSRRIKRLHIQCQESDSLARSFIQESLQNLLLIKAFSNEEDSVQKYGEALAANKRLQIKRNTFSIFSGMSLSLGFWLGYLFAITWGAYRLSAGIITFGTMTAFLQLVGQVQSPFLGLAKTFPRIFSTIASAGRIMTIEDIPDEANEDDANMPTGDDIKRLEIKNVGYFYDKEIVLNDVNMLLDRGDFAILAGPSGEGKTTILRMLLGLIAPKSGNVALSLENGERIAIGKSTRRYFSYVPQGNTVFSGSIEENLRYGKQNATEEELIACAKAACIYDFIAEQPNAFKTAVGEKGLGLSEGQAQRIAIARALLRDAPIILFDEATSSLDEATEANIIENLKDNTQNKICLFISHRESVNRLCAKTFYLRDGCITQPDVNVK